MNDLTNITATAAVTISSLEIAGLTAKRHDHVMRDIRKMLPQIDAPKNGAVDYRSSYIDAKGEVRECFILPKHETMVLVTGYSIPLRDRILRRLAELEAFVANATPNTTGLVTNLAAEVRNAIGGITKGIVHKELTEIIPALVRSELASQALAFRRGQTSGQIWKNAGFPRMRVTSWFSNRLCEMGCQIEGGGRGELGLGTAKLFDPDKAELWLKNGGRVLVEAYIKERQGQTVIRLVGGKAA